MLMDSISKKSPKWCALYYLQLGPSPGYRQQTLVQALLRDGAKHCL